MSSSYNDWPNDAAFNTNIEQLEPKELVVHGVIPAYAAGSLYRAGPGCHKVEGPKGEFSCSHWFDGFSHLYRFQIIPIEAGKCKVIYNSRRQVDGLIDTVRKTGKLDHVTFGQKRDPCDSIFAKLKSTFTSGDKRTAPNEFNVAVTVCMSPPGYTEAKNSTSGNSMDNSTKKNTLVTFTDSSVVKKMDPETLEPLGIARQSVLNPELSGPMSAAHAQWDTHTGDFYNYNLDFGIKPVYRVFKTSAATGKTEVIATIIDSDAKPAYIHSFFLTDDFIILAIWTSHIASNGAAILLEQNIVDAIKKFDPNAETTWLVIDRNHSRGLVAKFKSPAAFSFHSINAFQEKNEDGSIDIYCDAICYQNLDVIHRFYYENLLSTGPGVHKFTGKTEKLVNPSLVRFRLADVPVLKPKVVLPKVSPRADIIISIPGPETGELPSYNRAYKTRKQRFVYCVTDSGLSSWVDGIVKTDIDTQKGLYWGVKHHTPGEPIFVPNPEMKSEDDGVILSVVLDGDKGTSYLVCLNAKDMVELGRAEVDAAVGMGFHGRHIKV